MSNKRTRQVPIARQYAGLLSSVSDLLEQARRTSARTVNTILTSTYWEIGRQIVEFEQGGKNRADYGDVILARLSDDLTKRFGRGFGPVNLSQMRKFYRLWPTAKIFQTLSEKSGSKDILEIKDPYVLEFLGLKDEYSENDLEGLPNKVLAAEYKLALPNEKKLAHEVEATRRRLIGGRK